MNIAQRLERLEQSLNPTKSVRIIIIPHELNTAECEQFIHAEVERLGGLALVVPAKAPPD